MDLLPQAARAWGRVNYTKSAGGARAGCVREAVYIWPLQRGLNIGVRCYCNPPIVTPSRPLATGFIWRVCAFTERSVIVDT